MVNNDIKLLDKIHLQKYIYLLNLFVSNQIDVSMFEDLFLQIRREDNYWLSGLFNKEIEKVLDTLFLDIDEYTTDDLFNPNDKFSINETELRKRASEALNKLNSAVR
jgi:hypothetical protein